MASIWQAFQDGMSSAEAEVLREKEEDRKRAGKSGHDEQTSSGGGAHQGSGADALGAAESLFGGVKDMFDQGARQLGGGGDRNNAEEEGEKAMKGIEEQVQQASQGAMEVFTKIADGVIFLAEIPLDAARGVDGGMRGVIGHNERKKTFSVAEGDDAQPSIEENLALKGKPTMFRAVKGQTPREQETPQNWDWDAISPSPA